MLQAAGTEWMGCNLQADTGTHDTGRGTRRLICLSP